MSDPQEELLKGIRGGDRSALARAITLVESDRSTDRTLAHGLIEACRTGSERTLRIGLTGIPGVGKSTLIDVLGITLIEQGHRVAVLAVDPSSERSGGSILGDKTRMERLSQHKDAFIRPTATGGTLGGVARRTREVVILCEAAGYDRIIIETVGIGQNELKVDRMTDLNVLLMIAGTGDELQGIKRGIMESADLIALNKVDGEGKAKAEPAMRELRNALGLLPSRDSGRHPEVVPTSGLTGDGIQPLIERIDAMHAEDRSSGRLHGRRKEQDLQWLRQAVEDAVLDKLWKDPRVIVLMEEMERAVSDGSLGPLSAADRIAERFRTGDAPLP